eukprot:Nk52_evm4s168 gene=Nk52_evmTU4s168
MKAFGKFAQYTSEKIGKGEKTKYDEDFMALEKETDATMKVTTEMVNKTTALLQPDQATRAKMSVSVSKGKKYPQPEGELGKAMIEGGNSLSEDSSYGNALLFCGEFENQIAEARDALDTEVMENFVQPFRDFLVEFKDVTHHRKKLESRRLNYDHWKKKEAKINNDKDREEFRVAKEKFESSKESAHNGMVDLLQKENEHIYKLCALVDAQFAFHQSCVDILGQLSSELRNRAENARARDLPHYERDEEYGEAGSSGGYDRRGSDVSGHSGYGAGGGSSGEYYQNQRGAAPMAAPKPKPPPRGGRGGGPQLRALYDFDAESPQELSFREGDVIAMVRQVDANWYEGELYGKKGIFPTNYVERL